MVLLSKPLLNLHHHLLKMNTRTQNLVKRIFESVSTGTCYHRGSFDDIDIRVILDIAGAPFSLDIRDCGGSNENQDALFTVISMNPASKTGSGLGYEADARHIISLVKQYEPASTGPEKPTETEIDWRCRPATTLANDHTTIDQIPMGFHATRWFESVEGKMIPAKSIVRDQATGGDGDLFLFLSPHPAKEKFLICERLRDGEILKLSREKVSLIKLKYN